MLRSCCFGMLVLLLLAASSFVSAHGSVTAEDDLCIIRIGFYTAHFKIYQPRRSGHREFCEDLPPAAGLDALTVFHRAPLPAPDVLTARHEFAGEGDYIGVVTARHPVTQEEYLAVFPFEVGDSRPSLVLLLLGLLALAQAGFWWSHGGAQFWLRSRAALVAGALLMPVTVDDVMAAGVDGADFIASRDGGYRVRVEPDIEPLPLNVMHGWSVRVELADGRPASDLDLTLTGGMPAHNHGLPSSPQVKATAVPGDYRVEGLRFHMQGEWVLELRIHGAGREDFVSLPVGL